MRTRIGGVFPPIPTIFTAAGDVDLAAIAANVTRWMATGLAGVLALGSNGEAVALGDDESDRILGAVRDVVPPNRLLIAGTGRESTRATVEACRRAARTGADVVLVRPPAYFKAQMTAEALTAHFRRVADESPAPVQLYNLPATGVVLSWPVVQALAEHPNIVGIKETSVDLERLGQFASLGAGFRVLSGSAPVFYPALMSGAVGGILAVANVLPDQMVAVYDHVRAGRLEEALMLQRAVTPIAQLVTSTYGIAGLKYALDLRGYRGGPVRSPLLPLADRAKHDIAGALAPFGA